MPTWDTYPEINDFAMVWALIYAIGRTLQQCEKQLTHLKRYVYPLCGNIHICWGVLRAVLSMCIYSNHSSGNGKGSTGLHMCLSTFIFWHCMQDLDHSQIRDFISGHTYLSVTSLMDALAPRWDRLCRLKKKVHHNDPGIKGHIFPVLVSYTTSSLLLGDTSSLNWVKKYYLWEVADLSDTTVTVHKSNKIPLIALDIVSVGMCYQLHSSVLCKR